MRLAQWLGVLLAVGAGVRAGELVLPGPGLERSSVVTCLYRTNPPATGKGVLSVEWTDNLGRVVQQRAIPVELADETEIRFPLDIRRAAAMVNRLHVHLTLEGVNRKGEPDRRNEDAETTFVARPPQSRWGDYEVMMWQPQSAAQAARLKTIGINAGQYNGKIAEPPAFLLKNDMRGYAENIATDFYSEYHRYRADRAVNWSWDRDKELLRKQPASMEPFKRNPSLADPAWIRKIHDRLVESARRLRPYRPIFYDLGDESGIADLAGFWDYDFSDFSLAEMRGWLKDRYGTLAALNRQWGTDFATWELVTPQTTSQAMRRTDDNYSSWADHKDWMDESWERALKMGLDAVHSVDSEAYVAVAGGQMPGWGGYDYYRLCRVLDAIEPYDIGSNIEMIRSFNPGMAFVTTAFARGDQERHRIWYQLLHGARGNIIWDEKAEHVDKAGEIGARGHEVESYYRELQAGLGSLIIQSARQSDPIAIHYSQASMRTEWMLAQRPKGDAWTSRTSSSERQDSDFLRVRESWCKLIEDLGLQYKFVAYGQLENNELLNGYRVLILPRSSALSDAEIRAIGEFAQRGGLVIADGEPGAFDEHSRRRNAPAALAGVERIDAINYLQQRLTGQETATRNRAAGLLKQRGVAPAFSAVGPDGQPRTGVETHRFQNGAVTIIGLHSNPQQRVNELGPPEFKSNERFEKPAPVKLALPGEYWTYDVRRGKPLGKLRELAVTVEPYDPSIYAFSPTPLPRLLVSPPQRVARGESAGLGLRFESLTPAAHPVVRIDVIDPGGRRVAHYSRNLVLPGGVAGYTIPLALNDAPGRWSVRVTDLITGQAETSGFELY